MKLINTLLILFICNTSLAFGTNYGNYCGPGNHQWDKSPIDDLDEACQNHDGCLVENDAADGHAVCVCEQNFLSDLEIVLETASWTTPIKKSYALGAKVYAKNRIASSCNN